jgi:hypothetical protein
MKSITELRRFASPVPRPQALFVDGPTLWVSSRATRSLCTVNRETGKIMWETTPADGTTPWGVTKAGDAVFVVCGTDLDGVDDRTIRRVVPGKGFDDQAVWTCPENMGSHLSHDGASLVLSQWYPKKLISIGERGTPGRVLTAPHGIVGHCFARGAFYLATTDAEETDEYWLSRLDPNTGRTEDLARIGFAARALSFDGTNFWTNHRERDQIVCFTVA